LRAKAWQTLVEDPTMIILVTQDIGVREPRVAASIAADLNLDLISEEQLGELVAQRMHINRGNLQRLIAGRASLFDRWLGERRRLAWYTAEAIAKLAEAGDAVVQSWNPVGSLSGVPRSIRVHIGHPGWIGRRAGAMYSCQATISIADATAATGWAFAERQEQRIVHDLVLATALQSMASCVQQLRRSASDLPGRPVQSLHPRLRARADQAEPGACPTARWNSALARRPLLVEIGGDRMPLATLASSEQAIAQIEQHLQGKGVDKAFRPQRLPLPPDIL
jgi:hypothetical protein